MVVKNAERKKMRAWLKENRATDRGVDPGAGLSG
jgi:hypothetical protein